MGDSAEPRSSSGTRNKTVLVTGFGPFGVHAINASWVAVEELVKLGLPDDITLVTDQIDVVYDYVKERIPQLWKEHNPMLMIHVGVSGIAKKITLEQQAHNHGYEKVDVTDKFPSTKCCVEEGPDCIASEIDMVKVCEEINNSPCVAQAEQSIDAGRYLCDFSFYTSLNIDKSRSAFIHVPCLDKPYSARETAEGIREGILAMLKQVA